MSNFLDYEGLKTLKNKDDELYLNENDIIDINQLPKSQNVDDDDLLIKGISATGELYTIAVEDFLNNEKSESEKMLYGTCSTATETATKVIVCTDATSLYAGLSILVYFSTANTANAPTINVNNLGEKNIYINGATASSSNPFRWATNTYILFIYDGAYWVPTNVPGSFYGTGSVAEDTAAKTSTINNFVLQVGTTVMLSSSTANTNSAPTFNVSATGAYAIWNQSEAGFNWKAGATITLTFDGTYWRVVGICDAVTENQIDVVFDFRVDYGTLYFYNDEATVSSSTVTVSIDSSYSYVQNTTYYVADTIDILLEM